MNEVVELNTTIVVPDSEIVEQENEIVERSMQDNEPPHQEEEIDLEDLRQEGIRIDVPTGNRWARDLTQDLIIGDPSARVKIKAATKMNVFI